MGWYEVFWRINFILGLLLIQFIFSMPLHKKKYFLAKWIFFTSLEILLSILILGNWEVGRIIYLEEIVTDKLGMYIIGGLTVIQLSVCYDTKIWDAFYVFVTAYYFEKIHFSIFMLVEEMIFFNYQPDGEMRLNILLYLLILSIFCALIYRFVIKVIYDKKYVNFEKSKITIIALSIIIIEDIIDAYMFVENSQYHAGGILVVSRIYSILFNVIILCMLLNILGKKVLQTENAVLEALFKQNKEQYVFSKDLINLINIKSHDIKKQIDYLKSNPSNNAVYLEEIETLVEDFETLVTTDNEALSIVLTEKSIGCKKHQIPFTCIVDGRKIKFMQDIDIYTLFSNLMDNAIEASERLPVGKRSISLIVKAENNFLSIHQENYFDCNIKMKDGYLKTIKDDCSNHGFGVRSMEMIVENYDGVLSTKVKENIFQVNILIPTSVTCE